MSKTAALTLSIGILAVIDTYLTATILPLPVWVTFIAWASFFAVGGTPFGLVRSVAANFMGILIASCTLIAISLTSDHPVSAAIWVGIGSAAMIVASVIPLLSYPPAIVFGFASTVGTVAATGHDIMTSGTGHPALIAAAAMAVGGIFGIVSELFADAMTTKAVKSSA